MIVALSGDFHTLLCCLLLAGTLTSFLESFSSNLLQANFPLPGSCQCLFLSVGRKV